MLPGNCLYSFKFACSQAELNTRVTNVAIAEIASTGCTNRRTTLSDTAYMLYSKHRWLLVQEGLLSSQTCTRFSLQYIRETMCQDYTLIILAFPAIRRGQNLRLPTNFEGKHLAGAGMLTRAEPDGFTGFARPF